MNIDKESKERIEFISDELSEFIHNVSEKLTEQEYEKIQEISDEIDDILIDCSMDKYLSDFEKKSFVYIMKDSNHPNMIKIGKTNNIENREHTLQYEMPTIFCYKYLEFNGQKQSYQFESILHKKYEEKRKRGEWFELSDDEFEILMNEYEWKEYNN